MQQQPWIIHFFASMQVHCATCMQFRKRIQSFKRSTTTSRDATNVMFGVTRHLHSAWGMPSSRRSDLCGYDAQQSAFHTVKIYVPRRPAMLDKTTGLPPVCKVCCTALDAYTKTVGHCWQALLISQKYTGWADLLPNPFHCFPFQNT